MNLINVTKKKDNHSGNILSPSDENRTGTLPYHIVIVGGGFGGLYAARRLAGTKTKITLIDRRNFHLFQPLLYQVATGGLSPGDIASPLRVIFNKDKNISVIKDEVIDIEPASNQIITRREKIQYDALIMAAGAGHFYFGNNSWENEAPGLKTIEEALAIRGSIFNAFEMAEIENDPGRRKKLLTFVIAGGGPTGVELAGTIGELAYKTMKNDFRNINTSDVEIILIEGNDRILPTYPPSLSHRAQKSLGRLGIKTLTETKVIDIGRHSVTIRKNNHESKINAETLLWAAGVRSSPLGETIAKRTGAELDHSGRIVVNNDLTIPGHKNIFIIGDMAHFVDTHGNPLPGVAPVAMQQGRYVARLIRNRLKNKKSRPFKFRNKGNLAVIGRNSAVADFNKIRLSGFPAWLLWIFVHIAYLIEFDNKLIVLLQWAGDYFTRKKGARLITNKD